MEYNVKRAVHLDFHTSPHIGGIGKNFTKENFQAALKTAHLQSITVFAKCHHGMCYYPTTVGTMHPGLDFDLTGAMIEAAHEIGVKAPVYITAGWSDLDSSKHPEWVMRSAEGKPLGVNYDVDASPESEKPYTSWRHLCLNDGAYCKQIYAITHEICARYKQLDGLFYDICFIGEACYCDECIKGMKEMGLDPAVQADAKKYYIIKHRAFEEKCARILHSHHPDATLFFNSGGANPNRPQYQEFETHFEMEDLPTAWGGYDKMPLRAKFFQKTGKSYLGMTGKFHLDWGEFGGFKAKEALRYEAAAMTLYGAGCSVGDHMHPSGEMEMETYKNIGYAYEYVEKLEPYLYNAVSTANIGIYLSEDNRANQGLSNILCEAQLDYDIVFNDQFDGFELVIFPDTCNISPNGIAKLNAYIKNGGKVLFMGNALVKDDKFVIDAGLEYVGKCMYDCDYLCLDKNVQTGLDIPRAPVLCRLTSQRVRANAGEVSAWVTEPYFSRTYGHFCGHKNTPDVKNGERFPGIISNGNTVYCAHPLATIYSVFGAVAHKRLALYAISQLLEKRPAMLSLGSQGRMTFLHQKDKNRYCLNMTYASPVRRGCAEIIEDILPVYNIPVEINVPQRIKHVYSAVSGTEIPFNNTSTGISFTLEKLVCHDLIVIEY